MPLRRAEPLGKKRFARFLPRARDAALHLVKSIGLTSCRITITHGRSSMGSWAMRRRRSFLSCPQPKRVK